MNTRFPFHGAALLPDPSRRRFIAGVAAGGVLTAGGFLLRDARAQASPLRVPELRGTDFDLAIGESSANFTGHTRRAVTVNGSLPGPTLRWREGTTVELRVRNALVADETSIHWHGMVLPANMDGVPGLSFNGIHPGETYRYRFDVRQSGTYWYHSHSGYQEQIGLYGAIVIDPAEPDPHRCERDYVVLLSDWTDVDPAHLFARLKKLSDYDNRYKRTLADFLHDARRDGLAATLDDRRLWGAMRMTPSDLSDVNGNTYTYLMNGTTSLGNWTGLFQPGEKVRLRFINGSSMTHFDVRIPGLKLTVIAADGQRVHPVSVDEFRIATAETFDVIVEPRGQDAFTIFAQDLGRTGCVSGTLAVREGLRAPVPDIDARPRLSMADMGHGAMGHAGHDMANMKGMEGGCGANMGMGAMGSKSTAAAVSADHAGHAGMTQSRAESPLIDMRSMSSAPKLDDPGIGLRENGRDVLSYSMLRSVFEDPDGREPGREIELHLTGHMQRFAWSFDGTKFGDAEPLRFNYGERLRIVLVNDTMMTHPIHLHGMWSDLENEHGEFLVRKHTIDMPPGARRTYRVRADALGRWAYHCHLLYHMEAGMMREVRVDA